MTSRNGGDVTTKETLADAVGAGRWMVEQDYLNFFPHVGIASGQLVVGYVGTPLKYNRSIYGRPVTLAQRCCQLEDAKGPIVLPTESWGQRKLVNVLTKRKLKDPTGKEFEIDVRWRTLPPRRVTLKGCGDLDVLEVTDVTDKPGGSVELRWVAESN
jgi:class 3 adenylate cyclase